MCPHARPLPRAKPAGARARCQPPAAPDSGADAATDSDDATDAPDATGGGGGGDGGGNFGSILSVVGSVFLFAVVAVGGTICCLTRRLQRGPVPRPGGGGGFPPATERL